MAGSRDDMVIRPRLQGSYAEAAQQAKQARALDQAMSKRGKIGRFVSFRAKSYVARTLTGAAEQSGLARSVGGTTAVVAGAVIVAGLVAARLVSGKSFEGMGNELQAMILGDKPQEARAKKRTREQLQANEGVMQLAGHYGITDQMREVGEKLYKLNLADETGRNKIDRMFPQDNTLDLLILRLRNLFVGAWEGEGISQKIDEVKDGLMDAQLRAVPRIYK